MANVCGKAYGLTAITRMSPWKTYGLRLVFFLIRSSLKQPWQRSAIFVAVVSSVVLAVLVEPLRWLYTSHAALPYAAGLASPALVVGARLGLAGFAAWIAGFAAIIITLAVIGAIVGSFWQPRWTVLGRVSLVQTNLIDLSFIHYARWVIVKRSQFPRLAPESVQPKEDLNYDYLIFESNFNGDWEKYIDAFSQVVPGGMDNIWRWSVRYPNSVPISPFLDYIRNCQYDTDHYYSAYPGAATNDVMGALALQKSLTELAAKAKSMSPEAFAAAYAHFTVQVQNCISTTGAPPHPVLAAPKGVAMPSHATLGVPSSASLTAR